MRSVLLAAVIGLAGCGKSFAHAEPMAWTTDLDAARERALREDRVVLVWADASWDTAGKELEHVTFQDPIVRARIARSYVPVRVDGTDDDDPDTRKALEHFRVVGVPTMIFLSADLGVELGRFNEFVPPDRMIPELDRCVAVARAWRQSRSPVRPPYPSRPDGLGTHWQGCG